MGRLLAAQLQPGERVIWQARPDAVAGMAVLRVLWWIGVPWLALTLLALQPGTGLWIGLLLVGAILVLAPLATLLHHLRTHYVITDRRALVLRAGLGAASAVATDFAAMKNPQLLDVRDGTGHLSLASGASLASPDTDATGRYGFRFVPEVATAQAILDQARTPAA
ncbi:MULTISPECIES: hypothetical protein [Rhodopseudomonas]|uniref:hypothetical protein n=1 Tax=Rhodopseudomonas TaxID=1073 RepID=UPI0006979827|nr:MULTISPECIES: hypothetical protein [Rhodopseudomonas]MDF3812833.1 hypothetical protein [Rhodopseudomonas sp. BAL398]WOK20163.1 hypothetical protein RBJ75_11875 [Rhodopseudomonas sp. BAL398]